MTKRASNESDGREAPVIIVGGGAAGLSTAGALRRRGIDAVVLEQDSELGGTWARRYDRLRLHTIRHFSGLAHWPIPRHYPTYLSRDEVVEYLRDYARGLDLRVETRASVRSVHPDRKGGGWTVETADGRAMRSCVVVVATGQYRRPRLPLWPGRDRYTGSLVHSVEYRNAEPYVGRRVLVIGAGNSGAEIATDLAGHGAATVAISVRTPPAIVPRDPYGLPAQPTSILLSAMPAAIADRFGALTSRLAFGDLSRFGLPTGAFRSYASRKVPLLDVGFVAALRRGLVRVEPAVVSLTRTGAVFADGSRATFDAIIAATGFTAGVDSILDAPDLLDEEGRPRAASGEPTALPGLYFVGFTDSLRGHLLEAKAASLRLARNVAHFLRPNSAARDSRGRSDSEGGPS